MAIDADTAVVMVDSQPYTGRRFSEAAMPQVVIDHHDTGGLLAGVLFYDIRASVGATSTIVTNYLIEKDVSVSPKLATALLYGIESETTGYPREATPLDDTALIWLFPRADKDLLAQIRNPKLPQSHFATFQTALANAFLYDKLVFTWCGYVTQPDIIAEIADFFIRFDQVDWSLAAGVFDGQMKLSLRADWLGGRAGEVLYEVVQRLGQRRRSRQACRRRDQTGRRLFDDPRGTACACSAAACSITSTSTSTKAAGLQTAALSFLRRDAQKKNGNADDAPRRLYRVPAIISLEKPPGRGDDRPRRAL